MKKNALSYCGELVRQADYDRFLISMFVPAAQREAVWTLLALNYEIAKTREVVSESTLGLIRLQWWRDMIGGIYEGKGVPEHEVLKPLSEIIQLYDLPRKTFETLIYAREFDLENIAPGNVEGLMNYADFTLSPLLELIIRVMEDDPAQEVIQPVAMRSGICGILCGTPYLAQQGRMMLPQDISDQYDLRIENIFDAEKRVDVCAAVKDVTTDMPIAARPHNVFLKGVEAMSDIYLKQIIANGYDVMDAKMAREPNFKVLRLFWRTKIL